MKKLTIKVQIYTKKIYKQKKLLNTIKQIFQSIVYNGTDENFRHIY